MLIFLDISVLHFYFQKALFKFTGVFNPFSTGTHFYLEICVRLDHFIDIKKGILRSED
ncbi:hypothetical protein E2C01_023808 [Portunus trituberculatus]|uniref:Uncharacterized protein n=1 Tax=Portunus trituberculatus TaxID=210409 RepID=A0A5B7E8Y7_PORTR|nr:hypothetical protein [Portunus trituberculatus]